MPPKTVFKKGNVPWNKGIKTGLVPSSSFKKGNTLRRGKRQPETSGENHPLWNGGGNLTSSIRTCYQYRQWRSDVFTRDNFTCQDCGLRGCYLEAHHIKELSKIKRQYKINTLHEALDCEELWNINNGITLCKDCHNKTKLGRL